MFDLDEKIKQNQNQLDKIKSLGESLHVERLELELSNLENQTLLPDFWQDTENSSKVSSRIAEIKRKTNKYKKIEQEINTIKDMLELIKIDDDEEIKKEIEHTINVLDNELDSIEISTLFAEKYDINNAIVTIHPGAGGTEAQDWGEMLYRMYTRWCDANNFTFEELDYQAGEEAGIKSVSFLVSGDYAYGYLKSEHGVHRLVRISPFDAGGRRHTSFASVEILPEINDNDNNIQINPDDIKMDVYRASGAGGQHINKTSSAVRLTHIPTGIVVSCQTQRSQFQNKETALKMLKSKLMAIKEKENKATIDDLKGVQMDIAWGSQIRSYVFCPYTMVKDHRTNYEVGDVQRVMNGDLNKFIFEYLKKSIK